MSVTLRVTVVRDGTDPVVAEFEAPSHDDALAEALHALTTAGALTFSRAVGMEWVGPWFPATWGALLPGDEVKGEDGNTWVVSRHLHPGNPHEVELHRLVTGERFAFTPRYDQPVTARRTPEADAVRMLMEQLGARPL